MPAKFSSQKELICIKRRNEETDKNFSSRISALYLDALEEE